MAFLEINTCYYTLLVIFTVQDPAKYWLTLRKSSAHITISVTTAFQLFGWKVETKRRSSINRHRVSVFGSGAEMKILSAAAFRKLFHKQALDNSSEGSEMKCVWFRTQRFQFPKQRERGGWGKKGTISAQIPSSSHENKRPCLQSSSRYSTVIKTSGRETQSVIQQKDFEPREGVTPVRRCG